MYLCECVYVYMCVDKIIDMVANIAHGDVSRHIVYQIHIHKHSIQLF